MVNNNCFFNREISWVEFNYRVLEEALDMENPVLERLKFLSIFSSNLDEFIMVRVSALVSQVKSSKKIIDASGYLPEEILQKLQKRISETVDFAYDCLKNDILKSLEKEGFNFYSKETLPNDYKEPLRELFLKKYALILTPMAIDQSRPFPFLSGKSLNILLKIENPNKPEELLFGVIPIPVNERFIPIPGDYTGQNFIYIEDFIRLFSDYFFKGYNIIKTTIFRITRDAELAIDEEGAEDLLSAIEVELKKRDKGNPIRLEIESNIDNELLEILTKNIEFYEGFCFKINGPIDIEPFAQIAFIKGYDHLKDIPLNTETPLEFTNKDESIFDIISKKDRMINLPFESFDPVIRFMNEAASDPKVLAIKQTLYRTSGNSPIVKALKKAVENGKQVTVLVELKARFDEAQNINWAKQLEQVGCHVVYGLVGLKTHCKMLLVVRDEEDGIKRYLHLATGNYNDKTAKFYTDTGLFTVKGLFGGDASAIFNVLTGYSEPPRWKKIVSAPLDMRNFFLEKIEIEINNVKNGGKGKILAKMNSLVDTKIIEALYKASNAGVEIKLIVRGMCCLVPGLKDYSDNISVISIVDRFLEHSRIFYFYNAGNEDIFLSSADWMERNFDRRVEILFPIEDNEIKKEIITILKISLNDNVKARILNTNGIYERQKLKKTDKKIRSQIEIYKYFVEKNKKSGKSIQKFIPRMNPDEQETVL